MFKTALFLWDFQTGKAERYLPFALDGKFSPKGNTLAVITLDKQPLRADGSLLPLPVSEQTLGADTWLTLVRYPSREPLTSLPIKRFEKVEDEAALAFSPDGKFLAFLSPTGFGENSKVDLKLLETSRGKELLSTPALYNDIEDLRWSPKGDFLTFTDGDGNLTLLDTGKLKIMKVTRAGWRMNTVSWSFDGNYFSFYTKGPHGLGTYIFHVP